MKKRKNKFFKIIIACLMCFFCAFSCVGCVGGGAGGGSSGGGSGGSSSRPGGSGSGSGSGSGGSSDGGYENPYKDDTTINDINDVLMGAIGVYELNKGTKVFFDKYQNGLVDFNFLLDRQFDTLATYLVATLTSIYGASGSNSITISDKYTGSPQLNVTNHALSGVSNDLKTILNDKDPADETYIYLNNAIAGGHKINFVPEEKDPETGEVITPKSCNYAPAEGTEAEGSQPWKSQLVLGHKDVIRRAMIDIANYIATTSNKVSIGEETLDNLTLTNQSLINLYNHDNQPTDEPTLDHIDKLGLTTEFLVHVAYFIAYRVIGFDAIDADGLSKTIPASDKITEENKLDYQNYKAYGPVIRTLLKNLNRLSLTDAGQLEIKDDNSMSTLFPRVKAELYLFFDDINDMADSEPEPEISEDDDMEFDDEEEEEPLQEGLARRLKQFILIPYINSENFKGDHFFIKYIGLGFKSATNDDYYISIEYEVKYNNGTMSPDGSFLTFEETVEKGEDDERGEIEYIYSQDLLVEPGDYIPSEKWQMGALYEDAESKEGKEKIKDCNFGSAILNGQDNAEDTKKLVEDSFLPTILTIDTTGEKIDVGMLNVYNALFDENMELNFVKNYLSFKITYKDGNKNPISGPVPLTFLMDFTPSD